MTTRPKTSYHPYLLVAFYLNCLPHELTEHIPRSTRHGWLHKEQSALYGYDWYRQNQHTFDALRQIVTHKRLLQINKALLRIMALQRFMQAHSHRIKENLFGINQVVLNNLYKTSDILGLRTTLKYLQLSYSSYLRMRRKNRCPSSIFSLCRVKHPFQLLQREVNAIIAYCNDTRFLHWPLAAVYYLLRRDGAAAFTLSTFYKYVSLLHLKRSRPANRRKNHRTGIRAVAPLQIIHADSTVFKTADNTKNYIYLIQDNFSRAILSHRVARKCKARISLDNLEAVRQQYLIPGGIESCRLLTDDGPENAGPVKELVAKATGPFITHLIAQSDIEFSNSMIEAANKQLKYRFLYHQHMPDHEALVQYVQKAVQEYNNRPHHVLGGLTPLEVLNGNAYDKSVDQQQIRFAKITRITENKRTKCCHYSF